MSEQLSECVLELPRTNRAPEMARRWLADSFAPHLDGRDHETARWLVSELVTNAVVHGLGRIEVRAELDRNRLRVEVSDEGPGFTGGDFHVTGGHGLWIVEAESSRWGIRDGAADVWFELELSTAGADNDGRPTHDAPRLELVPEASHSPMTRPTAPPAHALRFRGTSAGTWPLASPRTRSSAPSGPSPRRTGPSSARADRWSRRSERARPPE